MSLYRTSSELNASQASLSQMKQKIWNFRVRKSGVHFTTLSYLLSIKLLTHVRFFKTPRHLGFHCFNLNILFADHDILNLLHRFRPKFMAMSNSIPIHYDPYDFQHSCHLKFIENKEFSALAVKDEDLEHDNVTRKCGAVPFVGPYDFHADEVARKFASLVKEVI